VGRVCRPLDNANTLCLGGAMASIGQVVIYIVMACALIGALASIRDNESPLGKEFLGGFHAIGHIFVPVAGIMASIPYLSQLVKIFVGPLFGLVGADPSIAATSIIAIDMGGYQLASELALSKENWIIASTVGYMAGATIVFSIPVGLAMIPKADHPYMALGMMSGLLSIPLGIFATCALLVCFPTTIRAVITTQSESTYPLAMHFSDIFINLFPLVVFLGLLALGLRLIPNQMIKGFLAFGRTMDCLIRLVLVASVIEYFTSAFSTLFGHWGFHPIIADEKDLFRALEIAGYIGIMLSGAFPMVYLLKKLLKTPITKIGARLGLEPTGAAGLLASLANILAMYRLIPQMCPKDKVLNISFAVCAAFAFGDHLAFTANFQPNLVLPIFIGKITGGIFGFWLAYRLSVPRISEMTR